MPAPALSDWMATILARTEACLETQLATTTAPEGLATLNAAMRHAVLEGGKRIRPLLAHAAGDLTGAAPAALDRAGCAVELIHAYSLVHDDMPCMDNDVLRRGKPTVHVAYGEAMAMLAGDALQALAFDVLAQAVDCGVGARAVVRMGAELARAAGVIGMAGGQAIDLASVGERLSREQLEDMHRRKTGALLGAAVRLGAWCGGPLEPSHQQSLETYCAAIGLAFQVIDDVLDVEADSATLGKTAGKDAQNDKPTYVSLLGLSEARALAEALRMDAHTALQPFGSRALRLGELADLIVLRRS
ncbi:MAG: polyprenyl synthetase family protein [Burkholderiaceae bacterium]